MLASGPTEPPFFSMLVSMRIPLKRMTCKPDVAVGELVAEHRVVRDAALVRGVEQLAELVLERELLRQERGAALEAERRHRDLPALADRAEHVLLGGARTVEEHLVELGAAGHLAERPHLDAGLVHRAQAGTRGPWCDFDSGSVRHTTKHQSARCASVVHTFWPVITHSSPSSTARRLDVREVGAGVRLGEALAPQLLDRLDLRAGSAASARRCRTG